MNPVDISLHETWASAFVDGETSLTEQADWSDAVHEQLYYYTVTRQVLRGEAPRSRAMDFQTQRTTWVTFWAKVDAA
ncbi:MAG: hypothetical protein ACKN9C_07960 [Fluviibacter sp.]